MEKLTPELVEQLAKLGITEEILVKTDNLKKILAGNKTSLLNIRGKIPNFDIAGQAKLFIRSTAEGTPELRIELIRKYPDLNAPVYGVRLSDELKAAVEKGETVKITAATKNGDIDFLVSLDNETNQLNAVNVGRVYIQNEIAGIKLTDKQKSILKQGGKVYLEKMKNRNGGEFNAYVTYNAAARGLIFLPEGKQKKKKSKNKSQKTANDLPM